MARLEQLLQELCEDPPLLTGDALAAEFIATANNNIISQIEREIQISAAIAMGNISEPDDAR